MIAGQGKFANAETQTTPEPQLQAAFRRNTPQPMPGTNNINKLTRSI